MVGSVRNREGSGRDDPVASIGNNAATALEKAEHSANRAWEKKMAHRGLLAELVAGCALLGAINAQAAQVQVRTISGPLAAGVSCGEPPWLAHGLDAYTFSGCEAQAWVEERIGRVGTADQTLSGRRQVATYRVAPGAQRMTGPAVQHAFMDALKSIGATVLTPDGDQNRIVATQETSAGKFWFIFLPLEGSSDARTSYSLATWMIAPMPQEVQARVPAGMPPKGGGCVDPSWLARGPTNYRRVGCDSKDWVTHSLRGLIDGNHTVEGSQTVVSYGVIDAAARPWGMLLQRNFRAAFAAIGAKVLSKEDDGDWAVATQTIPAGEVWYLYEATGGGAFNLTTILSAPFTQEVEARKLGSRPSTDAPCGDPQWLVHPLSYFKTGQCDVRDWDMVALSGLPDGDRHLEGLRTSVDYVIADPARRPPGTLVQRNFLNALKAIGAKIVSDEHDQGRVVATQATPAGETWYVYSAGGGSDETRTSYTLTTLVSSPFVQEVTVRRMPEGISAPGKVCTDPPWLSAQFPAYKLGNCDYQDLAALKIKLPDGERTLAGRVLSVNYDNADRHHVRIAASVWRNYVDALQVAGAKLVSDPRDKSVAVLTQTLGGADYWFIYRVGNGNSGAVVNYGLQTLQIGGPPPKACKLEVYGVNFDFDKSILRADSEPVLKQVLALFTGTPAFAAEIGGHTDNVGKPAYNLQLSDARAAAVRDWLIANGVAGNRLTSHGYGDSQPLMPNTTDENRFKNRRVELKRTNCQ